MDSKEEKKELKEVEASQDVKIEETQETNENGGEQKYVPYSRFAEVIKERNEKEKLLKKLMKEREEAERKKLEETEQFKTLYEKTQKEFEALSLEKKKLEFEIKKRELLEKKKVKLPLAYLKLVEFDENIDEIDLEEKIDAVIKQFQEDLKEVTQEKIKIGSPTSPAETENIGSINNPPDPISQPELYKAWLKKYYPSYYAKTFKE